MNLNSDTTAAIDSLESLLKAKIKLQDAQSEAEPLLKVIGSLFEPEVLNDDQKRVLQNGLKSLRKLLEAHSAYSAAVEQAEPARAIVNQLLSLQPADATNGKPTSQSGKAELEVAAEEAVPDEATPDAVDDKDDLAAEKLESEESKAEESEADLPKVSATAKASGSTRASSSKKG